MQNNDEMNALRLQLKELKRQNQRLLEQNKKLVSLAEKLTQALENDNICSQNQRYQPRPIKLF